MRAIIPLSVLAIVGFCSEALADARSDVLDRVAQCNSVSDSRAWLDCYYAAAQPQRAQLGLAPAPQAPTFEALFNRPAAIGPSGPVGSSAPAGGNFDSSGIFDMFRAAKVPPEEFGLTNARPGPGLNVDRMVDRLSGYTFANGKFTVTLANGQVWRQIGGPPANWRSTPANYTATITNGALRTFNLQMQDGARADDTLYKVERIH